MSENARRLAERRVLILAPTGRDAALTRDMLAEAGIRAVVCADLGELVDQVAEGAGALLISEEALANETHVYFLAERMARQPPWSDLPILLLTHPGADSPLARMAVRNLGNVTLLERPVRVASLRTAAHAALRARQRQFGTREHLHELDHVARALGESEGRLKALFSNAAVGIAEIAPDGRFALVNDALCSLLGESREALLALPLARVAHPDDRAGIEAALGAMSTRALESYSGEHRLVRRDGAIIWVNLSITLARDGDHTEPRGVAVIEDVTERKHAEQDLREADRRKDEFLAVLAHELRNPLAPIRNSLHILRMGGHDSGVERVVDMMERQVQHMVRLVDDLMEVSRISRGKIELKRERVDLADILRGALDASGPLIEAARHRLQVRLPDAPLPVDADVVRLSQVFANLLNNAAKYTAPGGELAVTVTSAGGLATVSVKDNGEGIPGPMLGRVFNMFTQVNTGHRAQGGLGIGLTLARTLVDLHGGSIEALSEGPGKGCEVLVRLPLAQDAAIAQSQAHLAPAVDAPLASRRVMVVDDNRDAADSLGLLLQFLGAEVEVVHSGAEALDAMARFRPAVVLLDLGMPQMDGLEVARRVRGDPQMRAATLVALTGWGQREDRRRTGEAGFDYHLVKPADLATLRNILTLAPVGEADARH